MDNKYYTDYFESFLREAVDEFSMQPSTKIWKGIYNNIHPGRKYPSFSTILIIIAALYFTAGKEISPQNYAKQDSNETKEKILLTANDRFIKKQKNNLALINSFIGNKKNIRRSKKQIQSEVTTSFSKIIKSNKKNNNYNANDQLKEFKIDNVNKSLVNTDPIFDDPKILSPKLKKQNYPEKKWTEAIALDYVNPEQKKNNINYEFYAAPSIGFRSMSRFTETASPSNASMPKSDQNNSYDFRHIPGLNVEAGGALSFGISKIFRLKAGMQLNYSGYTILAEKPNSTVSSTIQVQESTSGINTINCGNSKYPNLLPYQNGEHLNSNRYQISIPLGTEWILAENESFEWSAGASIQPSYIFGGDQYIMSADMKNYINDASAMRKWNVNTSIETLLSFKLKNGSMVNAGPQLRYQLLSSYDSRYLYNEKLYNLGLKFGVTRRL